jgi:hypothetical protein
MAQRNDEEKRKEERDEGEIKVTDRRLFTEDGELRESIDGSEEAEQDRAAASEPAETPATPPSGESEPQQEPRAERPGFERRSLDEPEGVDFTMLINAMAQPALIFLGEVAHPGSGERELNLEQARLQIDLLDMLRIKCRGNLTAEEEGLLDRILYQLRMLYVSRSNQPAQ